MVGISSGGGIIFHKDGSFEPLRKTMTECRYDWQANEVKLSFVAPPEYEKQQFTDQANKVESNTTAEQASKEKDKVFVEEEVKPAVDEKKVCFHHQQTFMFSFIYLH